VMAGHLRRDRLSRRTPFCPSVPVEALWDGGFPSSIPAHLP
jgi:hypothetical protein